MHRNESRSPAPTTPPPFPTSSSRYTGINTNPFYDHLEESQDNGNGDGDDIELDSSSGSSTVNRNIDDDRRRDASIAYRMQMAANDDSLLRDDDEGGEEEDDDESIRYDSSTAGTPQSIDSSSSMYDAIAREARGTSVGNDDDSQTLNDDEEDDDDNDNSDTTFKIVPAMPSLISTMPKIAPLLRPIGHEAIWTISSAKPGNGVDQIRDNSMETYWQSDGHVIIPGPHSHQTSNSAMNDSNINNNGKNLHNVVHGHLINIQFNQRKAVSQLAIYLDYNLDESYTPRQICVKVGMTLHDLEEVALIELNEPVGWVSIPLKRKPDPLDHLMGNDNDDGDSDSDISNDSDLEDELSENDPNNNRNNIAERKHYKRIEKSLKKALEKPIRAHLIQLCILSMHQNGRDTHIRQCEIFGPRNQEAHKPRIGRRVATARNNKMANSRNNTENDDFDIGDTSSSSSSFSFADLRKKALSGSVRFQQDEDNEELTTNNNIGVSDIGTVGMRFMNNFDTVSMTQFNCIR